MLEVKNVNLFYGAAQALRGVSMKAEVGKVTCVLGRNGVGKTSLLRAIVGHHPIADGDILWDDSSINGLPSFDRARRGIAYVPQGREIFPLLTVQENLETGFAGLPSKMRFIPEEVFELFPVLKTMMKRRGGDLSGGQQQQLAIGRALVTRPRLLVLDEPTEGIQPSIIKDIGHAIKFLRDRSNNGGGGEKESEFRVYDQAAAKPQNSPTAEVRDAISHLREKGEMAILLVEQYFEFAHELADAITVLDRGEVIVSGDKSELDADDVRRHLTV
tara:strand:- start:190 stop:1008 length:819 start_codon:yes stop_codon:yes gene_type:complete